MIKIILAIGLILLFPSCSSLNEKAGLEDDHLLEEVAEGVLKEQVGIDIDLTPASPEK